jgi:hypothetical protein
MVRRLSTNQLILIVLAVAIIGMGYWASRYLTWVEEEIDMGYSQEAKKDEFLAIGYFLREHGVASQTLRNFGLLDNMEWQGERVGPRDTLVLLNAHKMLRGQRLDNLLSWVENGGTVITSTNNPFVGNEGSDPLLDQFGITVNESEDQPFTEQTDENTSSTDASEDSATDKASTEETADKEKPDNHYRCALFQEPQAVEFFDEAEPLLIDYSRGARFDYYDTEPDGWAGDDQGLHMAQFNWGQGLVVINSDNGIWSNWRVDCHDHAYALWKLIEPDSKVWFLVNQEAPSLWRILWQATPYGMLAAMLALALWLWARAVRFGPILTRTAEGRRSLAEHIHASAMLMWRRQQHPYLVERLREDLRQQLQQLYPQFNDWPEAQQINHLHQLTSLSPADLQRALFSDKLLHPQDFTLAVACLQTIRKNL